MRVDKINAAIATHAGHNGNKIALRGANSQLSYAELQAEIQAQQRMWCELNQQPTIALALDNHPAWVVLDLAALASNIPLIPLPFFFSNTQWLHAIADAGVNIVVTDHPELFEPLLSNNIASQLQWTVAGKTLTQFVLKSPAKAALPANTAKITYTSGSTGTPKGVCLSTDNMMNVATSIADATKLTSNDIHLNVLPLATLLENVAGVYAPLLAGACCVLLPGSDIGLTRATGLDIQKLLNAFVQTQASTAIFTPELLNAMVHQIEAGAKLPNNLRFLAVGGASVSPALLKRAQQVSIPVYEGYGLSECASVVALNTPAFNKTGSVGKVLPHLDISFTDEHEVVVNGNAYLGYVGQSATQASQIYTGDIGYIDADGYLVISGRKKNIFITSFGRNVSPEWVERELTISPSIAQAALFGEARPWNTAIIVPGRNSSMEQIKATIQSINDALPDYARITQWLPADEPFTLNNQQLTANGRNRRDAIWQHYQQKINALYER
ncbi:AMP-binding protein [Methylotenera mobilis]|uniref:AMP-dependent synthetase and ligase n=1 Tax=Methylotenera mobilis (strain JLW8 / ATCC BAA-1282 / DSM 17540) TaxID=583345 RepID=C6WY54_METML|nr:AMP-binding protein [Methylotenera mobilis]ACT46950.1 AMP-dependent synthetase and ligase [Methylotenera mobilis JLW8]